MKFRLSNRQRKELMIRGTQLQIAIPAPAYECDDAAAYFAAAVDLGGATIVDVHEDELHVGLPTGRGDPSVSERRLGEPLVSDPPPEILTGVWLVLVATLRGPDQIRRRSDRPTWPGMIVD
jgi:hypothetical protein